MGISRNFADALHTLVDNLPVREESTTLDLHKAIEAELVVAESDPGVGYGDETVPADDHE